MDIGFNTWIVLLSVIALGLCNGIIGVYIMLYKKALVSDAVSHAALPGVALGYFLTASMDIEMHSALPIMLICAGLTGYLSILTINKILHVSKLKEDAAISISLSVYFALGIVLFSAIQSLENGTNRHGLDSFLLGQISGVTANEAWIIITASVLLTLIAIAFHKHFIFQSFDKECSRHLNPLHKYATQILQILMMAIICIGLKTTGAILVLALLIIPAATARLWSSRNNIIIMLSACFAILGAVSGTLISASSLNFPTGATITVILFGLFIITFVIHIFRTKLFFGLGSIAQK